MMKKQILALAALASMASITSCTTSPQLVNPGMAREFEADRVNRVKIYVSPDGRVVKRTLYVDRVAIPDWAIEIADKEIGSGTGEYYEVEWYADAPNQKVYEVTRLVRGKKVEVSMNENREIRYIEKELSASDVPPTIRAAATALPNFDIKGYEEKKGPSIHEYYVEGMMRGSDFIYTFNPQGQLLRKERVMETKLQLASTN